MRKLIVSSLVSLDGIHGDPQSWVGEFFDEQAVQESLATLLGLVDQLTFVVNPVVAGSGTTLFRPGKRTNLRLTSVTQRRNGAVVLSYASA